jgi:hypothetical protein
LLFGGALTIIIALAKRQMTNSRVYDGKHRGGMSERGVVAFDFAIG